MKMILEFIGVSIFCIFWFVIALMVLGGALV